MEDDYEFEGFYEDNAGEMIDCGRTTDSVYVMRDDFTGKVFQIDCPHYNPDKKKSCRKLIWNKLLPYRTSCIQEKRKYRCADPDYAMLEEIAVEDVSSVDICNILQ